MEKKGNRLLMAIKGLLSVAIIEKRNSFTFFPKFLFLIKIFFCSNETFEEKKRSIENEMIYISFELRQRSYLQWIGNQIAKTTRFFKIELRLFLTRILFAQIKLPIWYFFSALNAKQA